MSNIKQLKANNSNIYPITHEDAVLDENGTAISEKYATKEYTNSQISALNGQIDTLSSSLSEIQSSSEQINNIAGDLNQLQTSNKSNLVSAINEAFQYGNSVKQSLVDALIAKDVSNISTSTSMSQLITKIGDIEQGGSNIFEVTGLPAWYNGGSIDLSNTWATGAIRSALQGHAGGTLGDYIYICGGLTNTYTTGVYQQATYRYNPKTNVWETRGNLPVGKYEHACAVANNKLYAICGYSGRNARTDTVYSYSPSTNTWSSETAYSGGTTYSLAAAGVGNNIYVSGGYTSEAQSTFYVYDTQLKTWTALTSMSATKYNHAMTAYNNRVYAMGGYRTNTNYCYDTNTKQWTTQTASPENVANHAISVIKNKIYLTGGQTGNYTNTTSNTVRCFDPSSNKWETTAVASLPVKLYNHAAIAYKNNLYVICGRDGSVNNTVYCYIPRG
jgi:N-acetylneuraminic acid mutarotase